MRFFYFVRMGLSRFSQEAGSLCQLLFLGQDHIEEDGKSPVVIATLLAVLLNVILPKDEELA